MILKTLSILWNFSKDAYTVTIEGDDLNAKQLKKYLIKNVF